MGNFFSLDSPFVKFGNLLADIFILSILWLLTSILTLGIGIGASTTAIYYVMTRRISDKEHYITKDYFKSFKREFIKSTIVWIIILFLLTILFFYYSNFDGIIQLLKLNDSGAFLFKSFQFFIFIELLFFSAFVFPILSRFDLKLFDLFKNSLVISNKHFLTSIACILTCIMLIIGVSYFPPLLLIGVGIYSLITSYMLIKVFKKYRPEIDADLDDENE